MICGLGIILLMLFRFRQEMNHPTLGKNITICADFFQPVTPPEIGVTGATLTLLRQMRAFADEKIGILRKSGRLLIGIGAYIKSCCRNIACEYNFIKSDV
jgi:hypothetical protein